MPFAYVVLALIVLVVLHELGHFLAARAVGIRATKFYIFFPPALLKRTIGGVEYGIGAIPAGGFVKLPGMFEPVPSEIAARVGYVVEDVLPLVRDGDERLRIDAARRSLGRAEFVRQLEAPLREIRAGISQVREGEVTAEERKLLDRSTDRIDGMLDDMHPQAYWRASLWRRMTVIFAGPLVNLIIAFVVLMAFYWFLIPTHEIDGPLRADEISKSSPAAIAGLGEDSRIVGWNGPVVGADQREFEERFIASRGKPVTISWLDEAGTRTTRTVFPARIDDKGPPRIGLLLNTPIPTELSGRRTTDAGFAAKTSLLHMREVTWGNLVGLAKVFVDRETREQIGSVVGIVDFADEVDRSGQIVLYVGVISLILAVMNLLPLLPLDGGHLLFGVLEAARRGRVMPRAAFERYSLIGLLLVLALFFIGLDNDIDRIAS